MNLRLTHANFGGSSTSSLVHVNALSPGAHSHGHFCAAILSDEGVNAQEIWETILKEYTQTSASHSAFEALKQTVERIEKHFEKRGKEISLAILVQQAGFAYLGVTGQGSIGLWRDQQLVQLLPYSRAVAKKSTIASGVIKSGDVFILATTSAQLDLFFSRSSVLSGGLAAIHTKLQSFSDMLVATSVVAFEDNPRPQLRISLGLRQKIVKIVDLILTRLPQHQLHINVSGEEFRAHRQRKYALITGIVLMVILGLSIVVGIKRKEALQVKQAYQAKLHTAKESLEEARSLKGLSQQRARELLLTARQSVAEIKNEGIKDQEVEIVAVSIEDSLGEIAGLYKHEPQMFLDLSLISQGFSADEMFGSTGSVLVLDKGSKKLVRIGIASKKTEVLAGPESLEGVDQIALYDTKAYIQNSEGIFQVQANKKKVISKDWQGDSLIFTFANNMYVLDKGASQIYRYPGLGDGFGVRSDWLAADVRPNFSSAIGWAIDGSIWVFSAEGKIIRLSLGRYDTFSLSSSLNVNISWMYTDEETEDLYLLDKQQGKIFVVDKKGQFRAEYEHELIKSVTKLIVSTEEKKMLLGASSKLFALELKHL